MGLEFSKFSPQKRGLDFSHKKGGVSKIGRGGFLKKGVSSIFTLINFSNVIFLCVCGVHMPFAPLHDVYKYLCVSQEGLSLTESSYAVAASE